MHVLMKSEGLVSVAAVINSDQVSIFAYKTLNLFCNRLPGVAGCML